MAINDNLDLNARKHSHTTLLCKKFRFRIDSKSLNKVYVLVVLDLSKVTNPLYQLRDKDLFKSKDLQVVVAAAKLPILNPNEFDLWKMKIEQYFLMTDYSLWEVILNGDSPTPTKIVDGVVQSIAPTTTEQRLAKKNELKAIGTLFMALPDKHQLKFNIHKDAKTLMKAIEKRNKVDLVEQSLADLFNNLKIYEAEVKDLKQIDPDDLEEIDRKWQMTMLTMRARRFLKRTRRNLGANRTNTIGFDMSKVECYNCHKIGHFAWECRSLRDNKNKDTPKKTVPMKAHQVLHDQIIRDNALVELRKKFEKVEKERDELKLTLDKFLASSKNLSKLLESQVYDKTSLGFDSQVFDREVFDYDELHSQESDNSVPKGPENDRYKTGEGYHVVPPPNTGTFMPYKPDLVFNDDPTARIGLKWLFDIDTLTKSINYQPVVARNQATHNAGIKEILDADVDAAFDVKENEKDVHVFPSRSDKSKKNDDKAKRDDRGKSPIDSSIGVRVLRAEFEEFSINSTNRVNAVSAPVTAAGPNLINSTNSLNTASPSDTVVNPNIRIDGKSSFVDPFKYFDDPDMLELKDIIYSDDKEDVGVKVLVDLPKGKRAIGSKWVFRNKKDERGIVIRNKARLVAQRHTQEEGINYNEVFAPVARIKDIRLFLAYASFMGFMVYQMDVKSAFLYGTIEEEEVYVYQPPGFEDPDYPDKVYKVVKAFYGLHQAPRAWYKTLANYLLENGFQKRKDYVRSLLNISLTLI
nr:putative ribonuclease H-like domain-containing protein [Tanacetum cinerariifolium]